MFSQKTMSQRTEGEMADTNDMTMLSQEEIDKLIKKMEEEKNS